MIVRMMDRLQRRMRVVLAALLLILTAPPRFAVAQVFLPDDPHWIDPDRLDVPPPEPRIINDYYDFWIHTFGSPGEHEGAALNVNTLGEVPNSSWYTNRHYNDRLSPAALGAGPNTNGGPSESAPWRVVSGKTEGKALGMEIVDARGDRYLLKFDPADHLESASSAEVVATKLFYALGFNVPENYVVSLDRNMLVPGTEVEHERQEAPVSHEMIDMLLENAARYPDGRYRAVASKIIEGEILGPFAYYGTRPDDANDIFPHEARRELRGLRLMAAWINHTDARSINSLDVLVEEDGRRFVRHYLIDLGSTFGVGPEGLKPRWDGHEYILDIPSIFVRALTLGIAGLEWAAITYSNPDPIGRIDVEHFEPEGWRPQYPNPAFRRMDAADAFWAAKQIMHFTDEELRVIAEEAQYSDLAATDHLVSVLTGRRDKIGRRYLDFAGGLDRFDVVADSLIFVDLPAEHGFVPPDRVREVVWHEFDNRTGRIGNPIVATKLFGTRLPIPASAAPFIAVDIRTSGSGTTRAYLRSGGDGRRVVGIERSAR